MRNAVIGLFGLNIITLAIVLWLLMDRNDVERIEEPLAQETQVELDQAPESVDSLITVLPSDARIAYFFMDSVSNNYQLVADKSELFKREAKRLEDRVKSEARRAQQRYQELVGKDYTFSTQEEIKKSEAELAGLQQKVENTQLESERELAKLEMAMLEEVTLNLTEFLEDYNGVQGLDFIYSIQPGGQIWVGNEGLDITDDVLRGLNNDYQRSKQPKPVATPTESVTP